METCKVTFDETQPCSSSVSECAGNDEIGEKIFDDEEDDAGEVDGDHGEAPATHVPTTSTMTTIVQDGSPPTPTMIQQDHSERHRRAFMLIIHPQESSTTLMNIRRG
jgi:hypothetical protein